MYKEYVCLKLRDYISIFNTQATVRRDLSHQNVMQSNTARIVEQMNYEDVEPYLLSYFIISLHERSNLVKEAPRDKKLYVIEKVFKGTEETFKNFLRALEDSQDDCNHQLMIHLQQAQQEGGQSTPMCLSEMLHTLSCSMQSELVFGETPIQSPVIWMNAKTKPSSNIPSRNRLPHHCTTEQERPLSTASPNYQTSPLSINSAPDSQDDSWVVVHAEASNITYSTNLALLMEYICNKLKEALAGTKCVQQIHSNVSIPVKLAKAVYLEADPNRATQATRAADTQIQQSYKLLMKILEQLKEPSYPDINIDLNPILKRIGHSPDKVILSNYNIEGLILAVEELNQKTRLCLIL